MKCPTCQKLSAKTIAGTTNRAYPFCCDRCQSIDLGNWFDEAYRTPGEPASPEDVASAMVNAATGAQANKPHA